MFDPTTNRIRTDLLTPEELAALKAHGGPYECHGPPGWLSCEPQWITYFVYRAKPAPAPTIMVNGISVPEPVREALAIGEMYWLPSPFSENFTWYSSWTKAGYDYVRLERGLIHRTNAAAVAHAKAMVAPSVKGGL